MSTLQTKWFDRKFDFSSMQNIFPSVIERLRGTPVRLEEKTKAISEVTSNKKVNGSWSVKENIGHLIDLEPLWMGRLTDILSREIYLRTADLNNTKTNQANHNDKDLINLLNELRVARLKTIQRLEQLTQDEISQSSLHPRLKTPMRTMHHFLFVAEHDDHHLVTIHNIIQSNQKE